MKIVINHVANVKSFKFCTLMTSDVNVLLSKFQSNPQKKHRSILAFSFFIILEPK